MGSNTHTHQRTRLTIVTNIIERELVATAILYSYRYMYIRGRLLLSQQTWLYIRWCLLHMFILYGYMYVALLLRFVYRIAIVFSPGDFVHVYSVVRLL